MVVVGVVVVVVVVGGAVAAVVVVVCACPWLLFCLGALALRNGWAPWKEHNADGKLGNGHRCLYRGQRLRTAA